MWKIHQGYLRYLTVFDYGESLSATAMGLFAMILNPITRQREIHLLKEYHHLNNEVPEHQKKNQLDYVNDYVNFIQGVNNDDERKVSRICSYMMELIN